jgi:hypothetical protein
MMGCTRDATAACHIFRQVHLKYFIAKYFIMGGTPIHPNAVAFPNNNRL